MAARFDLCFITAGDARTAEKISSALLRARLAACVNSVPGVRSSYWWKGAIETAAEVLLVAKTRRARRAEVIRTVKENHTYEVPETVFASVDGGSPGYLAWLGASTAPAAARARKKGKR